MSTVIKIEGLSKQYRFGVINRGMLYRDIQSWIAKMRGKDDPNRPLLEPGAQKRKQDRFWALEDVTFDIAEGDVVGIIGRNGAGKSTLLKVLSEITTPTRGRVLMKGRVASLLEVGTGFHQELTGEENVYLNGAILGLTRRQIRTRFDEIAEFSGVSDFLSTPVKRYSSGMRVRLAFSVAAHLDPEILIIDEVLAVGDAAFRHKCMKRLGEIANEGRTVLFVSHNMTAVEHLCTRGVVLEQGRVVFTGSQQEAVRHYLANSAGDDGLLVNRTDRQGTGQLRVVKIDFRDEHGSNVSIARPGVPLDICLHYESQSDVGLNEIAVHIAIDTPMEAQVFAQSNLYTDGPFSVSRKGVFVCRIPELPLPPAGYRISYKVDRTGDTTRRLDSLENAVPLQVEGGDFFGTGQMPDSSKGLCLVRARWHLED